jgi:hypothetical protein
MLPVQMKAGGITAGGLNLECVVSQPGPRLGQVVDVDPILGRQAVDRRVAGEERVRARDHEEQHGEALDVHPGLRVDHAALAGEESRQGGAGPP